MAKQKLPRLVDITPEIPADVALDAEDVLGGYGRCSRRRSTDRRSP